MKVWGDSGRVQDKLINRLERQEKQKAFQRDRFLKFKLPEIHARLTQSLLMNNIIETEKKALNSTEFDFKYFIAPIRSLVPRANPYSLYMTQYIMEVLINEPEVIEVYGTDLEIYGAVNEVISLVNIKFEKAEEEIASQLAKNRALVPGSREYEIALDEMVRRRLGEPQK